MFYMTYVQRECRQANKSLVPALNLSSRSTLASPPTSALIASNPIAVSRYKVWQHWQLPDGPAKLR